MPGSPSATSNPLEQEAEGLSLFCQPRSPATGLDVRTIRYLETTDGRRVFCDINANSTHRPSVAREFGIHP